MAFQSYCSRLTQCLVLSRAFLQPFHQPKPKGFEYFTCWFDPRVSLVGFCFSRRDLYSPGCPETLNPPVSASPRIGLQECPTMTCFDTKLLWRLVSLHSTGMELPMQVRLASDLRSDCLSLVRGSLSKARTCFTSEWILQFDGRFLRLRGCPSF